MSIDIKLTDDGDITIPTQIIRGVDYVIQRAKIRTETWKGEWIRDSRVGIPWLEWLQQKPVPLTQIEDFLRAEYEDIDGVRQAAVVATFNPQSGVVGVDATLYLDSEDTPLQLTFAAAADEPAVIRSFQTAFYPNGF